MNFPARHFGISLLLAFLCALASQSARAQSPSANPSVRSTLSAPRDTDAPPAVAPPPTLDDLDTPPKPTVRATKAPPLKPSPRTPARPAPKPRPIATAKPQPTRAPIKAAPTVRPTPPSVKAAPPIAASPADAPPLAAPSADAAPADAPPLDVPADAPSASLDDPVAPIDKAATTKTPNRKSGNPPPQTNAPHSHDADSPAPGSDANNGDAFDASAEISDNSWPPFLYQALYASLLVAIICSYLGLFVVLRRIVFVGVALAELSGAGIALALYFAFAPLLGSVAFTLIGIAFFSLRLAPRRVPSESFIGIIYAIAGALAILLIAKSAQGETHMLKLMQGDVLTVDSGETRQMLWAFLGIALVHLAFAKEFVLVSFDRDAASTLGFSAARWELLLLLTIGVAISFAIRATGVLLTSTMLVLPAVTALLLTRQWRAAMIAAPLLAIVPVVLGLHLSLVWDVPASAMIVVLSFVQLLPALAWQSWGKRN